MENYNVQEIENLSLEEQEIIFQKMLDEQTKSLDLSKLNLGLATKIIEKEQNIKIDDGVIVNLEERNNVSNDQYDDYDEDLKYEAKIREYESKILQLKGNTVKTSQKVKDVPQNEIDEAFKNLNIRELNKKEINQEDLITLDNMSYDEIANSSLPSFIKEKLLSERKESKEPKQIKQNKKEIIPIYEQFSNIEKEKKDVLFDKEEVVKIVNNVISQNNKKILTVIGKIIKENNEKLEKRFNDNLNKEINKILLNLLKNK